MTFLIWLLVSTSPTGDFFIHGHYDSLFDCVQDVEVGQECVSGTVLRMEDPSYAK